MRSIVSGSLLKDPHERFQSVDDMLEPLLHDEFAGGGTSTLHPGSLSSLARKAWPDTSPADAAATLEPAPVLVAERVDAREGAEVGPAEPVAPATAWSGEGTVSSPRRIGRPIVGAVAWFTIEIGTLVKRLGTGLLSAVRFAGRALWSVLTFPFVSRSARAANRHVAPRERSVLVRLVWALVGSTIFAGGVCCIVVGIAMAFDDPEEALLLAGVGIALVVFSRRLLAIVSR